MESTSKEIENNCAKALLITDCPKNARFDQNQLYCCLSLCLFAIPEVFQPFQIFESKEMSDYLSEEVVLQPVQTTGKIWYLDCF